MKTKKKKAHREPGTKEMKRIRFPKNERKLRDIETYRVGTRRIEYDYHTNSWADGHVSVICPGCGADRIQHPNRAGCVECGKPLDEYTDPKLFKKLMRRVEKAREKAPRMNRVKASRVYFDYETGEYSDGEPGGECPRCGCFPVRGEFDKECPECGLNLRSDAAYFFSAQRNHVPRHQKAKLERLSWKQYTHNEKVRLSQDPEIVRRARGLLTKCKGDVWLAMDRAEAKFKDRSLSPDERRWWNHVEEYISWQIVP